MADSPPGGPWALGQPPKGSVVLGIDETNETSETINETIARNIPRIARNITNITRFTRIY